MCAYFASVTKQEGDLSRPQTWVTPVSDSNNFIRWSHIYSQHTNQSKPVAKQFTVMPLLSRNVKKYLICCICSVRMLTMDKNFDIVPCPKMRTKKRSSLTVIVLEWNRHERCERMLTKMWWRFQIYSLSAMQQVIQNILFLKGGVVSKHHHTTSNLSSKKVTTI